LRHVFHAGDGNLHPLIVFDAEAPDEMRRWRVVGADILETSVRLEAPSRRHGVGLEKLNSMCVQFSARPNARNLWRSSTPSSRRIVEYRKGNYDLHRCARGTGNARARGMIVCRLAEILMDNRIQFSPQV